MSWKSLGFLLSVGSLGLSKAQDESGTGLSLIRSRAGHCAEQQRQPSFGVVFINVFRKDKPKAFPACSGGKGTHQDLCSGPGTKNLLYSEANLILPL